MAFTSWNQFIYENDRMNASFVHERKHQIDPCDQKEEKSQGVNTTDVFSLDGWMTIQYALRRYLEDNTVYFPPDSKHLETVREIEKRISDIIAEVKKQETKPKTKEAGQKQPPPQKPPVAAEVPEIPEESDDCQTCPLGDRCWPILEVR
jgi:hypothetical protein